MTEKDTLKLLSLIKQALDIVQGEGLVTQHPEWTKSTTDLLIELEGHT